MAFSSEAAGDHLKGPAQIRAGAQAMRGTRAVKPPHRGGTRSSPLPPQAPSQGTALQKDPQPLLLFTHKQNHALLFIWKYVTNGDVCRFGGFLDKHRSTQPCGELTGTGTRGCMQHSPTHGEALGCLRDKRRQITPATKGSSPSASPREVCRGTQACK